MKEAIDVLKQAASDRFWGNIQFDFQGGEITVIRKSETIKLQGKENNSRPYDQTRASS